MIRRLPWALLAALVLAQIAYPLADGAARARLTIATVALGYLLSVSHALLTRGPRTAATLVLVTTGGGLAVEAVGVATGLPFGGYAYSNGLGPRLAGVPLVVPLAWTWMAWPAWLAAARLTRTRVARVAVAAVALAAWDVFLDPQMVAAGHWSWHDPTPALPGAPGVPLGNHLGWLVVAAAMMALLDRFGAARRAGSGDGPMHALYLWTYGASLLAHAVFLDLPGPALWGGLAMAPVALPLAGTLLRGARAARATPDPAAERDGAPDAAPLSPASRVRR